jgi:hypothetical protein
MTIHGNNGASAFNITSRNLGLPFAFLILLASPGLRAQDGFTTPEGPLDNLFILKDSLTARISSYDRSGGNHDWVDIAPGETKVLAEIPGAGVIRRFYMAPLAADRMRYRKVVLRMFWDGEKDPSVEVPLGDFFGSGLGTLRYFKSLVVNVNPGNQGWDFDGMVNYLPMPFAKGARITVENDGKVPGFLLWYHIDYEQYPGGALPDNVGRLHAQWRRSIHPPIPPGAVRNSTLGNNAAKNTTGEDNFVILEAEGQGSYVGLFLIVDNVQGGWYGEGDDMIFVDGAKWPPTYPGTGHEEIFNSGCCPDTEFWGPYTGFYLIENYKGDFGGKNLMYRFYVNDPVRFKKSIRVTVEHGHANNYDNDYTSTAFWYQTEPHRAFPPLPSAQERLPGWPPGVAEAMEKEQKAGLELQMMVSGGKVHLSPEDGKLLGALVAESNKAFRALRYPDYLKAVEAEEALVNRYKTAASPK